MGTASWIVFGIAIVALIVFGLINLLERTDDDDMDHDYWEGDAP